MSSYREDSAWWNEHFPFLRVTNNSVEPWLTEEDSWVDAIPIGWKMSFFEDMCDELMAVLGASVNDFEIEQLTEKYGAIRAYWGWKDIRGYNLYEQQVHKDLVNRIEAIIDKYTVISSHTCVNCGRPSTLYTHPWILPLCDGCDR